jgi:hypothetical protein
MQNRYQSNQVDTLNHNVIQADREFYPTRSYTVIKEKSYYKSAPGVLRTLIAVNHCLIAIIYFIVFWAYFLSSTYRYVNWVVLVLYRGL